MSIRKQFSQELHTQNDIPARLAVSQYVEQSGLYVRENEDKYGPDLVVYRGFRPAYYIEVEVKRVWRAGRDTFPYPTVQLPERKQKFLKLGMPIEFWLLREDLQYAVIVPDFVLEKSPLVEVPNKYMQSGELFFQVDISQCQVVDIT